VTDVVCLVTGAAQGIGEAIARRLAEHGARLALVDANEIGADRVACELRASGVRALAACADVRDGAAIETVIDRVERELGAIGVLVNGAGILRTGTVLSFDDRDWADTFAVNTTGVFIVSRAVARRMVRRRSGVIVTVGSNAAGVARMDMAAYAASKAAAAHFTTPMQRALWTDPCARDRVLRGSLEKFRVGIPLGRIARPEDVANAVLFLASDSGCHITMHDLYVDGGATLRG
jgi:2,3-dihydro-2,3-dihydroxybenzoate dehydrogenase